MGDVLRSVRKHIVIPHPSPQIDKFPTLLNVNNVLRRNSTGSRSQTAEKTANGRNKSSCYFIVRVLEAVRWWQRSVPNLATNVHCRVLGWSPTGITPLWSKSPIPMVGNAVRFPVLCKRISGNKRSFVGNEGVFDQSGLYLDREPLAPSVKSVEEADNQQPTLYEHRWRVPGFIFGAFLFGASVLLDLKCAECIPKRRLSAAIETQWDRWFWLSVLCNIGMFTGAFLMLIWPRIS
jgi:hypothetical protein